MDSPSWTDTLRAALASPCTCIPCFIRPASSDSDTENDIGPNASYAARRARADELEGLLADAQFDDDGDDAADTDAISLHSHLGPRGRRRPPPRTPRHISLFGIDLFGAGKLVALPEEGADPLHGPVDGARGARRGSGPSASTADLLAAAAKDPIPEQLTEEDVERRARRRARKEMRRMAAAVTLSQSAELADPSAEFEGFPGSGALPSTPHPRIPIPFMQRALPPQDDPDDDADLDGGVYTRPAPRSGLSANGSQTQSHSSGRSSGSGSSRPYVAYSRVGLPPYSPTPYSPTGAAAELPPIPKTRKSKSSKHLSGSKAGERRSTRSKSSGTSSTLASPPPSASAFPKDAHAPEEFGAFAEAQAHAEFDGAPGGFDGPVFDGDNFDGTPGGFEDDGAPAPAWGKEVVREALPSAGLTRAGGSRSRGAFDGGAVRL
ncbi:hypothetical protein GGX14DRAFT_588190 [Mycena pura]|uniref:Uncharacterized protein n=1 Tax=Mycena pura TaxID=153505 RepID=A0AAD6USM6_9AGAR|nr:hypothetical protein GGX14DRAFT_588190 [Mycena pura]